jgi:hypothetical protein
MKKNRFSESQQQFYDKTHDQRDQCMWQIIPAGYRFELECWRMIDGTMAIFQIFADGAGFMEYIPK